MGDMPSLNKAFFPHGATAHKWASASFLLRLHDHTQTHHTRQDSSGRVLGPMQIPLNENTQRSQQTNIHALGEIRTHNLRKGAAADPRLRPCGRRTISYISNISVLAVLYFYCSRFICHCKTTVYTGIPGSS